jgi:tetratricopeptide (TPR) repeat protein
METRFLKRFEMMHPDQKFRSLAFFFLGLALLSPSRAQQMAPGEVAPVTTRTEANSTLGNGLATNPTAGNLPSTSPDPVVPPTADPGALLLHQAFELVDQKQLDAALAKVNASIQASPKNPNAFALRAAIEVEKKLWDQAGRDFQSALQLDRNNSQLKFDLVEIPFMQKKYDAARPGFVALEHDLGMGDLAAYKAFLCELFGGHEDEAAKELAVFNQVGENASYYFANAAWLIYHKKPEEARSWLMSAANIYSPAKVELYARSLIDLGYLPLPPPPDH